jgi:hypothetical protein
MMCPIDQYADLVTASRVDLAQFDTVASCVKGSK